jgi:hypothetical protein
MAGKRVGKGVAKGVPTFAEASAGRALLMMAAFRSDDTRSA